MKHFLIYLIVVLLTILGLSIPVYAQNTIFSSRNLSGLQLFAEPLIGGDIGDIALRNHRIYGELIANVNKEHIWVNAIAAYKITSDDIQLGQYSLSFETKLPARPSLNVKQQQNAEQIDFAIILYDGKAKFGSYKMRYEIAGIWKLNPYSLDYNKILMRTTDGAYIDTGIYLPYDGNWHKFTIEGDFVIQTIISVQVDNKKVILDSPIWMHTEPIWGNDVSIWASVECQSMYPQADCRYVFWWKQYYRNFKWEEL